MEGFTAFPEFSTAPSLQQNHNHRQFLIDCIIYRNLPVTMELDALLHVLTGSANNVIDFCVYIKNTHGLRLSMAEVGCQAPTLTCIRQGKLFSRLKAGEQERRYWHQVDQLQLDYMMELGLTDAKKKELANKRGKDFLEYGRPHPTTLIGTSTIIGKYLVAVDGPCLLDLVDPKFSAFTHSQLMDHPDPYFDSRGPFPRPTLSGIPPPTIPPPLLLRENVVGELANSTPFKFTFFMFGAAILFFLIWVGLMAVGFFFFVLSLLWGRLLAPFAKQRPPTRAHATARPVMCPHSTARSRK